MHKLLLSGLLSLIACVAFAADEPAAPSPLANELNGVIAECIAKGLIPADQVEQAKYEAKVYIEDHPCVFKLTEAEAKAAAAGTCDRDALLAELNGYLVKMADEPLPSLVTYLIAKNKDAPLPANQLVLVTRMLRCQLQPPAKQE